MAEPHRRLPRTIRLDQEVCIKVQQESPKMLEALAGMADRVGLWDQDKRCIYIDRTVNQKRKWAVLRHELSHALIDLRDEITNGGI